MHSQKTMIATNRFGLGARPGEAAQAASDPQGWLQVQLESKNDSDFQATGLKPSDQAAREYFEYQAARRKEKKETSAKADGGNPPKPIMNSPRNTLAREIEARTRFAVTTSNPFRERLVRFWSNHFTVSTTRNPVVPVAGAFEREAIRPHVTASFFDMLLAAEMHCAMLLYLDNAQSVGPNSPGGKRRGRGLNENLAREILELHTVGVNGGYSQEDVTNFAKVLTGWTIAGPRDRNPTGKTYFDERRHEPGTQVVMGKSYPDLGGEQAVKVLKDLSTKPETARFVSTKLARHFISDEPPARAVEKLTRAYLDSAGNLGVVSAELVKLDEAWQEPAEKFKAPDEFYISALRGLGADSPQSRGLRGTYASLGQLPFSTPSPAGWPDEAQAWLGPDSIQKRLEWSQALANRVGRRFDPRQFVEEALGASAGERTRAMVNGADSRQQGMTLALMAPEFQRR
ncbi:MAG: DUF1800 domain-containing protein [Xanthomonadales bacterium]|jgi:uncharacterized protein (DUF1800 family)|nr:DUF1800 domain-containing protein [Xanthomonadales bacterium]